MTIMSVSIYDSLLMNQMIAFKQEKARKYGNDYPTAHFIIPELGIDSLVANLPVMNKSIEDKQGFSPYGSHIIGGHLGMAFFRQYDRVLLDGKNRIAYFVIK
jgi:hypothetical protein